MVLRGPPITPGEKTENRLFNCKEMSSVTYVLEKRLGESSGVMLDRRKVQ